MDTTSTREILTLAEAADLLRISERTLWSLLRSDDAPPHTRIGRLYRFRRAALLGWVDAESADGAKGAAQ